MKTYKIYLLLIVLQINLSVYSQVSVTGTAYTEIVPLATVKETVQFNAGRFALVGNGGSVTITPQGTRLVEGSILVLDGPFSQGAFTIAGSEHSTISVILPSGIQMLYHSNSVNTIYIDKWDFDVPTSNGGYLIVNIGATLNFKSAEANPPGLYTGNYQVIFFYN